MTWEAHQTAGFFGFSPAERGSHGRPPIPEQPLHCARVALDEALEESAPVIERYRIARRHPDQPAFSGGVLDAWPRALAEGLAIAAEEDRAVEAYLRSVSRG